MAVGRKPQFLTTRTSPQAAFLPLGAPDLRARKMEATLFNSLLRPSLGGHTLSLWWYPVGCTGLIHCGGGDPRA